MINAMQVVKKITDDIFMITPIVGGWVDECTSTDVPGNTPAGLRVVAAAYSWNPSGTMKSAESTGAVSPLADRIS